MEYQGRRGVCIQKANVRVAAIKCVISKQTEETDVNELVHRMRRLRPSGFATITQHLVSLVVLHFPHFHTNAAESNAPYFIQGCKYYINCSRPISANLCRKQSCCWAWLHHQPPTLSSGSQNTLSRQAGVTQGYLTSAL